MATLWIVGIAIGVVFLIVLFLSVKSDHGIRTEDEIRPEPPVPPVDKTCGVPTNVMAYRNRDKLNANNN